MKTRNGKIAQLPQPIRDDLNHRLQNGQQSPELLVWLNQLPETKELLAKFNYQPINKSNLSDWRHGGFLEWLQDQAREARIQRISESGATFEKAEAGDLFENFARFAVAELMDDLDSLQKFRGEKRSRRLHNLIRDLARLQFGYNHSRRTELAWTKYNNSQPRRGSAPVNPPNPTPSATTAVKPDGGPSCQIKSHDAEPHYDPFKRIYNTRCCHKPCLKCHAPDSSYPIDEILRDEAYYREYRKDPCDRSGHPRHLIHTYCECACDQCAEKSNAAAVALPPATLISDAESPDENRTPASAPLQLPTSLLSPVSDFSPSNPNPAPPPTDFNRRLARLTR